MRERDCARANFRSRVDVAGCARWLVGLASAASLLAWAIPARADDRARGASEAVAPPPRGPTHDHASQAPTPAERAATTSDDAREAKALDVKVSGYVETYYAYNFNRPSNAITNYRAFDNRHNTFTLSNAVLAADARAYDKVFARVALQVGSTGESYFAAEPNVSSASGAAGGGPAVFKHIQEAYVGYGTHVRAEAGVFLSPIGPESMAIKDAWTWSRSNLFYGLPFYHTGARVTADVGERTWVRGAVYNGWNSVIDNNADKSFSLKLEHQIAKDVVFDAQYMVGVERNERAPEGRAPRHLFDSYIRFKPHDRVDLIVNSDIGMESNAFGTSGWAAGALFGRVRAARWLSFGGHLDMFMERRAQNGLGQAEAIFWPASWVSSQAIAAEVRPVPDHIALKLEFRHDAAAIHTYFSRIVLRELSTGQGIPNASYQNTLTLGATAWF